jgi:hypothetical protein
LPKLRPRFASPPSPTTSSALSASPPSPSDYKPA